MTLQALLEKVEAATGPDRELDLAIWNATKPHESAWAKGFDAQTVVIENRYGLGAVGNPVYELDPFTASIDAALALVERCLPDHGYEMGHDPKAGRYLARVSTYFMGDGCFHEPDVESGATQALAILSALLKALRAQGEAP